MLGQTVQRSPRLPVIRVCLMNRVTRDCHQSTENIKPYKWPPKDIELYFFPFSRNLKTQLKPLSIQNKVPTNYLMQCKR